MYSYPDDGSPTAQSSAVCPACGEELVLVVRGNDARSRGSAQGRRRSGQHVALRHGRRASPELAQRVAKGHPQCTG
jgi:hypothetical protein